MFELSEYVTRDKLDYMVALTNILLSVVTMIAILMLVPTAFYRYIEIPLMAFFAGVIYINIRKKSNQNTDYFTSTVQVNNWMIIFGIIYFFMLIFVILRTISYPIPYSRPKEYFVLIPFAVSLVSVAILLTQMESKKNIVILGEIIILSLTLRWIPLSLFPGHIGIDPWWHQIFTQKIITSCHIPQGNPYSYLPIMHLIIGETSIVLGINYKSSVFVSIVLFSAYSVVFIFLAGRLAYNEKVGLMAALFLGIADIQINYGIVVVPLTLTVSMIPLVIYLIFKIATKPRSLNITLLLMVIGTTLVLTHPLGAFSITFLLLIFYLIFDLYVPYTNTRPTKKIFGKSIVLFSIFIIFWYSYKTPQYLNKIKLLLEFGFSFAEGGFAIQAHNYSLREIMEVMLGVLGFHLYLGISLIGMFYSLSNEFMTKYRLGLALSGIILGGMIFLMLLLNFVGLMPGRWYPILQVVVSFNTGLGIFLLSSLARNHNRVLFISVITFIVSFFMITAPIANYDTPIYSKSITPLLAFTRSDLIAINFISQRVPNKTIIVDQYPMYYLGYHKHIPSKSIYPYFLHNKLNIEQNEAMLIRSSIIKRPFGALNYGVVKLEYNPLPVLITHNRLGYIYTNKNAHIFSYV